MNNDIIPPLTPRVQCPTLSPPSQKTKDGIETPHIGHTRPQSHVVFLCPPKIRAAFCRACPVMVGCVEQPVKRLACAYAGSLNLTHSTAQRLRPMGGGLFPFDIGKPQ